MNWFILSLIAILFWSGSDLFSKMGSPADDHLSHWTMTAAVGLVMGAHAIFQLLMGAEFHLQDIVTYFPASFLYILSMLLGYAGLRYIELSISSPICNSSGAVAALLCFLFLGDEMTWVQFLAVILITVAITLLAVIEKKKDKDEMASEGIVPEHKYTRSFLAIGLPILYCLIDGLGTFVDAVLLDGYIDETRGNIAYELTFLVVGIFALIYVCGIKKQKLSMKRDFHKLTAALSETAGQFFYIYAIGANAILAAPMISSYCIVSLLWCRIILKEKLTRKQYAVIFMAAVGIAILGME